MKWVLEGEMKNNNSDKKKKKIWHAKKEKTSDKKQTGKVLLCVSKASEMKKVLP